MTEPAHILVIEDDADTRANLTDVLELDGYRVSTADNLKAAINRTDGDDFAVVLSDRRLPDGNVDRELPRLRSLAPEAAIVVITGYRDLDGAIACLRAGADDYVLKPVNPDELRANLRRFIAHRAAKLALREAEQLRRGLEREVLEASTMEQQRIGRDLHDGLGQELTGIAFLTGVLKQKLKHKGLPEAADASEIVALVNQAIDHARGLVRGLCPVDLDADGLTLALEQLTSDVQSTHGLTCCFKADLGLYIENANVRSQLYYIAREAINNAVKHAGATRIDVTVRVIDHRMELSIADDGVGMSTGSTIGRGLHIMPYRARMIGATLVVENRPSGGLMVTCNYNVNNPMVGTVLKDR